VEDNFINNENENIYDKIQEILSNLPANFSILEEEIDIDLQMEYFEFARIHKNSSTAEQILKTKERLFDPNTSIFEKKLILCQLGSLSEVEAFRCIEKYLHNPDENLKKWAILALQECKMTLESSLLEENRIFISTGLGGKGNKLRYFIILVYNENNLINDSKRKLIKNEFEFFFKKYNSEIEEINYYEKFSTLKVLIPINVTINNLINMAINEVNQYGNFINPSFIITNLKILTEPEIIELLKTNPLDKKE